MPANGSRRAGNDTEMTLAAPLVASLPMYDRPENARAHDVLWNLIAAKLRAQGIAAPDALDREIGVMEGWQSPDLLLGQICNMPYRAVLRDHVTLVGASDYGLPDCPPGYYYSCFIVRADDPATDPADYRLAYNEALSHSGWSAPQQWAQAHGFAFRKGHMTGAHLQSVHAVAQGLADIAAIDAVSWGTFARWEPVAAQVRVIGRTAMTPGMSFVTAAGRDPAPLRAAVTAAIADLPVAERELLGLRAIVPLPPSAYDISLPATPDETLNG